MPLPLILIGGGLAVASTYTFLHNRFGLPNKNKAISQGIIVPSTEVSQLTAAEQNQQDTKQRRHAANRDLKVSLVAIGTSSVATLAYPPLFLVSIPLTMYGSASIFKDTLHGWREKKQIRSSAVDAMAILGTLAARYYFAASFINGMYFVGQKLLQETEDNSNKKLLNLFDDHPCSVWLWTDGAEIEVPFEQVNVGETVVIHTGDTVPFDGKIVHGEVTVDQHMLTGESTPQEKMYGDIVFANTLLIGGNAHILVTKVGKDTVSAQINETLQNTVDFNTTVDTTGTKVVNQMTLPTLLASGVALQTVGLRAAVSVINCNFSDIARITVPLGVLNHLRKMAEQGILVKDGRALELLAQVDTVVFDKTGSLTQEQPCVTKIYTLDDHPEDTILALAASVEHHLTHPVARAIQRMAKQRKLSTKTAEHLDYEPGCGIRAQILKQKILLGSQRFMEKEEVMLPESGDWQTSNSGNIHALSYLAIDGKLAGVIELQTLIRPEVPKQLKALRKRGLKLYILSGDHEQATQKLAESLGIDNYFSETQPKDKGKHIEELQAKGCKVCFIGDGINDAIAMRKAEVAISMAGAATVASDAANIVLLNKSLDQLDTLLSSAKKFERGIKSNLSWALIPGVIGVGAVFLFRMRIHGVIALYTLSLSVGATNTAVPLVRHHLKKKKKKKAICKKIN